MGVAANCLLLSVLSLSVYAGPTRWLVELGPIELEVSDRAIEGLTWRGVFVFGDHHSNRRPVAYPRLLTDKWQRLAEPDVAESTVALKQTGDGAVLMKWQGTMREREGTGVWEWRQGASLSREGQLVLRYTCMAKTPSSRPLRQHRYAFLMNRNEVLVPKKREKITSRTAGKPAAVTLTDGQTITRGFGGSPNVFEAVQTLALPFQGRQIRIRCAPAAPKLELWNGGWAQMTNFFLPPPAPRAEATLTIDLGELLDNGPHRLRFERIPARPRPWLVETIPARARPERPLRFAQCTPGIRNAGGASSLDPDETERQVKEMAKHFDVVELILSWADWKHSLSWDTNPKARAAADALAAKTQEWIDIGHEHGLMLALSLSFGGGEPGTGRQETRRKPEFQAEAFDPIAGEFSKVSSQFDWTNPEGLRYAREAWQAAAAKIKDIDFLFFNEPHFRLRPWHRAPFYSESALADYREFCHDPQARFPAKAWAKPTPRTNNQATHTDWQRWEDWIASVYARRIRVCTEAVRESNRRNPRYRGAIWFQNVNWVGPEWGTDLDKICALPEVKYIVCEYCTDAESEHWKKFKYFARKHGKQLSSFVNICWYDPHSKSRQRIQGDDDSFRRAVEMGVREHSDMLSLYQCSALFPWHLAYHPARTRIWDEVTKPYCLGAGGN